jgi:homoserine dehydrogenase
MSTQTVATETARIDIGLLQKTRVNVIVFGHGQVGNALIRQILDKKAHLYEAKDLDINIIGVANSTRILLNKQGVTKDWEKDKKAFGVSYTIASILDFVKQHHLEQLIAIDNTADVNFVEHYETLVSQGFHLVSSNKKANTQSLEFYKNFRKTLHKNNKKYL